SLSWTEIYLSFFSGCRAGENVTQPTEDVMAVEGQPTTLTCLFDTTYQSPNLFWYKQQPNGNPMFIHYYFGPGDNAAGFKERFNASLNTKKQSVPLTIQRLPLSDSLCCVLLCSNAHCDNRIYSPLTKSLCVEKHRTKTIQHSALYCCAVTSTVTHNLLTHICCLLLDHSAIKWSL
uniref:Ig-like domain-containing protein n=1 Tax=Hucho hucho TaxID=62062 RepID=A0A4W5MAP7_9TELE